MANAVVINARREGYGTDQCSGTITVGRMIEILSEFDEDTKVFIGNDRQNETWWYTYGPIKGYDIVEIDEDEEDEGDEV